MADVTLIRSRIEELLPMRYRSPGIHVSTLIHRLAVRMGHYKEREGEVDDAGRLRMELGSTLEWALIDRLKKDSPGRYFDPGELTLDDVHGTPDLGDRRDWFLEEVKFTWKSPKHDFDSPKLWNYRAQMKAYCQMFETQNSRLRVVHVRSYDGSGPKYRVYECRWSRDELTENWAMLMREKRKMEAEND